MRVKAKKKFGQHFLIDQTIISGIYSLLEEVLPKEMPVLEIGPGEGVLTKQLTHRGGVFGFGDRQTSL